MSNQPGKCFPQREKYWSELDSEQRIERLRTVVKRLTSQLDDARKTIAKLKEHSERHEHSPNNGLPVVPVKPENDWQNESDSPRRVEKSEECYI